MFTGYASLPLEQYTCTKQSWMEDYCKQDREVNVVSSEDWMGSSVDPPCFGQSMLSINHTLFETILTYRVICLIYYNHKYLVFIAYNELLEILGKKDKNSVFCSIVLNFLKSKPFWLLSFEWVLCSFSVNEWLSFSPSVTSGWNFSNSNANLA